MIYKDKIITALGEDPVFAGTAMHGIVAGATNQSVIQSNTQNPSLTNISEEEPLPKFPALI